MGSVKRDRMRRNERIKRGIDILIILIIFSITAYGGYLLKIKLDKPKTINAANITAQNEINSSKCLLNDATICNFLFIFQNQTSYISQSNDVSDDYNLKSNFESSGQNKFHLKLTGSKNYEVIVIHDTVYVKSQSSKIWWQQKIPTQLTDLYRGDFNYEFSIPTSRTEAGLTQYKSISRESCSQQQCYKYQVVDPKDTSKESEFIWFDVDKYLLQQVLLTHSDGSVTIQHIQFKPVSIDTPTSNIVKVSDDKLIAPGQTEPAQLPQGINLTQYLQQFAQN